MINKVNNLVFLESTYTYDYLLVFTNYKYSRIVII